MNTTKLNVEEAIRYQWMDVLSIVIDYYKEEGYDLTPEEINEATKIIQNIRIQG